MKRSSIARVLAVLAILAGAPLPIPASPGTVPPRLGGDVDLEQIPESASIRESTWDKFLAAPREQALAWKARAVTNGYGAFRLSVTRQGEWFYLIAAAEKPSLPAEAPPPSEKNNLPAAAGAEKTFPLYSQGSWIVKRSMKDGGFVQAKIFLRSDPGCFLRIYPNGGRSLMDVVVYGGAVNKEVPLPVPFERVLKANLTEIVAWSRDSVAWELFSPRTGLYSNVRRLVSSIRSKLPQLRYADDGALDSKGRPVYIATGLAQTGEPGLNCSGFAKWVADGIRGPRIDGNGREDPWLDTAALALRHPELRGSSFTQEIESTEDSFFGLDWTRNIAKSLADSSSPERTHGLTDSDVRLDAFALHTEASDPVNGGLPYMAYPANERNLGYEVLGIEALLYVLAIREPGNVYFAALNRLDQKGQRSFYHVAVIAPYFDTTGEFRVAVFESAAETSLEALVRRAPTEFVHLVRARAEFTFEPPALPSE